MVAPGAVAAGLSRDNVTLSAGGGGASATSIAPASHAVPCGRRVPTWSLMPPSPANRAASSSQGAAGMMPTAGLVGLGVRRWNGDPE